MSLAVPSLAGTDAECQDLWKRADVNGDGLLSDNESIRYVALMRLGNRPWRARAGSRSPGSWMPARPTSIPRASLKQVRRSRVPTASRISRTMKESKFTQYGNRTPARGIALQPVSSHAGWLVRLRLRLGTSGGAGPRSLKSCGPSPFRARDQMKSEATGIAIARRDRRSTWRILGKHGHGHRARDCLGDRCGASDQGVEVTSRSPSRGSLGISARDDGNRRRGPKALLREAPDDRHGSNGREDQVQSAAAAAFHPPGCREEFANRSNYLPSALVD